jgi:hypothetical protein
MANQRKPHEENRETRPRAEVYAVNVDRGTRRFSRRSFIELAAASSAGLALTSCGSGDGSAGSSGREADGSPSQTSGETASPGTHPMKPTPGLIPAGKTGKQLLRNGRDVWLPCDEPTPEDAVCTCDCVRVPRPKAGQVPAGRKGMQLKKDKKPAWLPCKSPLPAGYVCTCDCVNVPKPKPGEVRPGTEGIELEIEGETFRLPCGSPIPADAVCTCNCITVPECSCVGHTSTCAVVTHYWYPN